MKEKTYPVVHVRWVDSCRTEGWHSREDKHEPVMISSTGYLIENKPKHIAVSLSVGDDKSLCQVMSIPRCAIKSIKRLSCSDG